MKNIVYKEKDIKEYFSKDRVKWEQFYESEKKVIQKTLHGLENILEKVSVLDVGCACGGLGIALR